MATVTASVPSSLPAEEAFQRLAVFSNTVDWDPGVVGATRSGSGDVTLGEVFDLELKVGPRTTRMGYEVVELDAPNRVVLRARTGLLTSQDTIEVHADGDGSRIEYHADLRARGPLGLADPLLQVAFDRIADKAIDGLRSWIA